MLVGLSGGRSYVQILNDSYYSSDYEHEYALCVVTFVHVDMGEVAYKLELPEGLSGVHDVFHVSQLKRYHAEMAEIPLRDTVPLEAIQLDSDFTYDEKPVKILNMPVESPAARWSSFAKFSGTTIPRMKPPGSERKIY